MPSEIGYDLSEILQRGNKSSSKFVLIQPTGVIPDASMAPLQSYENCAPGADIKRLF